MKAGLWLLMLMLCAGMLLWSGCSSSDDNSGPSGPANPGLADSKTTEANTAMEGVLNTLINGEDPQGPQDIDLTVPYNLYLEALTYNSGHAGANFGAGMLETIMLTQDAQVQDFFDRMQAFMDADSYFVVPGHALRSPSPLPRFGSLFLSAAAPIGLTRRMCRVLDEDAPTVSELQSICTTKILPRLQTAIQRLTVTASNTDFVFTVTPGMQGDPNEDPILLHQTKVRCSLAGLQVLQAMLLQFCAYNLSLPAYDGAAMQQALERNSSFAALQGGGVTRMQQARTAWLGAIADVERAINFLESKTGDQSNHLIRINPYDDFTQSDLDSIMHYLPMVRNALNGTESLDLDLDDDPLTPPEAISISLAAMFNSPVQNLKMLFPPYTVALDTQVVDMQYFWDNDPAEAQVTISTSAYYQWTRSAHFEYGAQIWSWQSAPFAAPAWDAAWNAKVQELAWSPEVDLYLSFYGYVQTGQQTLTAQFSYTWTEPLRERFVPRITWVAESFDQWALPDPTIGGLLPGMTDSRFKELTGMSAENWSRSGVLQLW